jgi:hypothetical protein
VEQAAATQGGIIVSDERDIKIVELAIQAAGVADNHWHDRVVALVPKVAAVFREPSDEKDPNALVNIARKVAEASVFRAEYRGHELDDNTQRIFVKLYDEKGQDGDFLDEQGCQTVRTEPMWSASGRAMRTILQSCEVGQMMVCYRYKEQVSKSKATGLLVHAEPLRTRGGAPSGHPPARQVEQPRQAGDETAAVSSPAAPTSPSGDEPIVERINKLPTQQMLALKRACADRGIQQFANPSPEDAPKVLAELRKIESQEKE